MPPAELGSSAGPGRPWVEFAQAEFRRCPEQLEMPPVAHATALRVTLVPQETCIGEPADSKAAGSLGRYQSSRTGARLAEATET